LYFFEKVDQVCGGGLAGLWDEVVEGGTDDEV